MLFTICTLGGHTSHLQLNDDSDLGIPNLITLSITLDHDLSVNWYVHTALCAD